MPIANGQYEAHRVTTSRNESTGIYNDDGSEKLAVSMRASFGEISIDTCNRVHDLALLDNLPLELLQLILVQLDVKTLTTLRKVNKRARAMVDLLPDYRSIAKRAPQLIQASASFETSVNYSCKRLNEQLLKADCDVCGRIAVYIYLISCDRICQQCLDADDKYKAIRISDARSYFAKSGTNLSTVPQFILLPVPSLGGRSGKRSRLVYYDYDSLIAADRKMCQDGSFMVGKTRQRWHIVRRGHLEKVQRLTRKGVCMIWRRRTAIRVPWLDAVVGDGHN